MPCPVLRLTSHVILALSLVFNVGIHINYNHFREGRSMVKTTNKQNVAPREENDYRAWMRGKAGPQSRAEPTFRLKQLHNSALPSDHFRTGTAYFCPIPSF